MLEFDFNELDNDFITIWSRFILKREEKSLKGIDELAALGQINAIQNVMLLSDKFFNGSSTALIKIYNNLKYLEDKKYEPDFNEELVIRNANLRMTRTENELLILPQIVHKNLSNSEHLDLVLEKTKDKYLTSKNPLVLEMYYETKVGKKIVSYYNIKKLRKTLKEMYFLDSDNPSIVFAYAKNLCFFGSEKEKTFGKKLLRNLSIREFSETLQDAIDKRKMDRINRKKQREERKNTGISSDVYWNNIIASFNKEF